MCSMFLLKKYDVWYSMPPFISDVFLLFAFVNAFVAVSRSIGSLGTLSSHFSSFGRVGFLLLTSAQMEYVFLFLFFCIFDFLYPLSD